MKKKFFLFFLVLTALKFFDAVIVNSGALKNLCYGYMLFSIAMSLPFYFKYKGGFVLPIQILCISILISIFMAQYTWDQNFSFAPTTIPYLIWFTFFYLLKLKISIKTIETLTLIYGVIYIVLFLFQFTHSDVVYFGYQEEFKEDRGIIRIGFPGGGVFFLSNFIAINKVTSLNIKHKYLWVIYLLIGIIINILQVTRQAILCMLLIYLFHILRNVKGLYKAIVILFFVSISFVFLNSDTSISNGLAQQQKQDASEGVKYIRILAAEFFLTEFTPNTMSKILGNGVANINSNYGKILTSLSNNYGFFLSDVGLVEVYVTFGIFALIAYLSIFVKSLILPVPPNYYYLKYYLWLLMITSVTSNSLISTSFLITTVFVLYCYQRIYEQQKIICLNLSLENYKKYKEINYDL